MKPKQKQKQTITSIRVFEDEYKEFKAQCCMNGETVSDVLRKFMLKYLGKKNA